VYQNKQNFDHTICTAPNRYQNIEYSRYSGGTYIDQTPYR